MNLHPLIVHFPVALLMLYCGIELVTVFFYRDHVSLRYAKKLLLWIGTLSIIPALVTGEAAQYIYGKSDIIHLHEEFAEMSRNVFILISLIYLGEIATTPLTKNFLPAQWIQMLTRASQRLQKWHIPALLALVGVILLTGVGALGGAISRGADMDPIARFIIDILS